MSRFVLLPGAGGAAGWMYAEVCALLEHDGHDAVPVDFSAEDAAGGLQRYADVATRAAERRPETVLVAQSLGGFTAPLVAQRVPLRAIVFLNAMIPVSGERAADWWENTGSQAARIEAAQRGRYTTDVDVDVYFGHDVDAETWAAGAQFQREEPDAVFDDPCDFDGWGGAQLRAVAGAEDRFFPAGFQQRLARERLGIEADVLPGGHLLALSRPKALAEYLVGL